MDLILTVIRYQNLPSQQALTARVSIGGGTIGRNPDNDLALPDPDRWVGRHHAQITFRDGAFFLTDTSKNGTFVNRASVPLHEGQRVELHEGDELGIGAYEIRVSLEVAEPQSAEAVNPLDGGESGPMASPTSDHSPPDILELVSGPGSGGEPSLSPAEGQNAPGWPDDWLMPESPEEESGPVGAVREPPETPTPAAQPDHTPDENAFFRVPEAIPENYNLVEDVSGPQSSAGDTALSEPQAQGTPSPASKPAPEKGKPTPRASHETTEETVSPAQAAREAKALEAFLTGLGTGELPSDPQGQVRIMRASGLLLRAMTEGLMRVMMGRTSFKSELRLEMTAIQSTKNNPFKFSVDPEDALAHLLFRPSRGFLHPLDATHEAFDDIQCHEMAMIAGLRAALRALLARMDPAKLEKRFQERSLVDNLMPMARKAKCWDLFTTTYEEISADAADDFLHLFKDAFTAAYEEQATRLKQAKSLGNSGPNGR
jgi:type VI secretion system protein